LVERELPKLEVAGSRPVVRSFERRGPWVELGPAGYCVPATGAEAQLVGSQRGWNDVGSPHVASRIEQSFAYHLARDTGLPTAVLKDRHELAATVDAAPAVRRWIRLRFGARLDEEELEVLEVLLTELVSNAVIYAGVGSRDSIVVHMALAPERLRAEVCDGGPGFTPHELERRRSEPGGYGLLMVDRACSRWGIAADDGNCVWFELDREPDDCP
jgi:anti-sigma regulatory factor (Ser/Thr protein kinase)